MPLYDVIVRGGAGGWGRAPAAPLARRGRRGVGCHPRPAAHDQGSSHGRSRIIREAYWEHPSYVPLVWRAYELWEELERASGKLLLLTTTGILIGAPDTPLVQGALESARVHHLAYEFLEAAAIRRKFPVFAPADGMVGVLEPRAGVLFPEECILAHLEQAARAGAELHYEEPVLAWSAAPHAVEVQTSRGHYEAGALGPPPTADTVRREITPEEIAELRRDFIGRYMPAASGPLLASTTCMYTMTPDGHFIIAFHPQHQNVVLACGFSGHGFKFAPVVGEILADLALLGRTEHDISLFALDRFARG